MALKGIYFDTDRATVKPASEPQPKAIADFLDAHADVDVFVVGHTARGDGPPAPAATNRPEEGRAGNRRVVLVER